MRVAERAKREGCVTRYSPYRFSLESYGSLSMPIIALITNPTAIIIS